MAQQNISNSGYPMSINGAVPVGKPIRSAYANSKHVEKNSFERHAAGQNQFLGLIKLWNHYSYVSTPLISMTELSKNVLETNGFNSTFTFGIPFEMGAPFIVENLCSSNPKPGLGKKPFDILLSENKFTYGDILTTDKRNGRQLEICTTQEYGPEAKITEDGDYWKYKVVVTGASLEDYYPPEFLKPGTRYYRVYSENGGEFSNHLTAVQGINNTAVQMFQYSVGDSEMGIESWWTSQAQLIKLADKGGVHPAIQHLSHDMGAKDAITNFFNINPVTGEKINGTGTWMPTFIAQMAQELALMKESKLLWSQGNAKISNGREVVTSGLGYYQQIKQRGNHFYYSTFNQLYDFLQNFGSILFANNRYVKPDDRVIRWKMGTGAAMEIRKRFKEYFLTDNGFHVDLSHPALDKVLTKRPDGSIMYRPAVFNAIFLPEVGLIEFEIDSKLDYIDSHLEQDEYTGRYPNSSYMVFIEDLTDGNFSNAILNGNQNTINGTATSLNNTVMIKPAGYEDHVNYVVGSGYLHPVLAAYTGNKSGSSVVSTKEKGFGISMYTCGEIWVQDPTRVIMLEYKPEV